jgi:hypothetical protein
MRTNINCRRAFAGLLLGGLFLTVQTASAQIWSSVGSTCTPDEDAVTANLYVFDNGTFRFNSGSTGAIKARCHVINPMDLGVNPLWDTLTVGYVDPVGTGANYRVFAQLVAVYRSTGAISSVRTFDSSLFAATGSTSNSIYFAAYPWDFVNYAYFVAINVERANTAASPGVWFVKLSKTGGIGIPNP